MPWTQVKPFNPADGGNIIGLCLANVRKGYGIPAKYNTAYDAWLHTVQHTDKNFPEGVAVPVFWKYIYEGKQSGHVAVQLPDGRVWTDGRYFRNMDELNTNYLFGKGIYLGWGESLNDVTITKECDMDCKPDAKTVTEYFVAWEQRKPTVAELADYTSKSWRYLTDNLLKDTEAEKKAVQLQFEAYKKTQVDKAVKAVTVALS